MLPQLVPHHSGFGRFRSPRRAEREACGVSATGGNATEHNEAIGDGSAARTDQNHCGEVLTQSSRLALDAGSGFADSSGTGTSELNAVGSSGMA